MDEEKGTETNEKLQNLERVLYKRATETETTVDVKTHRIVHISGDDALLLQSQLEKSPELARRFQEEGVLFKQEVTVRQHLPDATIGRWMHEHLKKKEQKELFEQRNGKS